MQNKSKLPSSLENTLNEFETSLQSLQTTLVEELEKPVDDGDKKKLAERQIVLAYLLNVLLVSLKVVQGIKEERNCFLFIVKLKYI